MSIKIDGICVVPENIYPYPSPIVFGVKGNCNGIFDGDILSRGYQIPGRKITEISGGARGSMTSTLLLGVNIKFFL